MNERARQSSFICLTDVPTPYRVHFFERLAAELQERGIAFEAWFMARSVKNRNWQLNGSGWRFRHRVLGGIHPIVQGAAFHVNPTVLPRLMAAAPEWVLVGGGWQVPSAALVLLARHVALRHASIIFWAEANRNSTRYADTFTNSMRRLVLRNADALAVPGSIARSTLSDDWGIRTTPFIELPNVVDENVFGRPPFDAARRASVRSRWGVAGADRMLFWPARLDEGDKGIV